VAADRLDPRAQSTGVFNRATPCFPPDRFFGVLQRTAFEPARRRASLASLSPRWCTAVATWCSPQLGANRPILDRFERTAMSRICVATNTVVPVQNFLDFLRHGGVYGAACWITSTLPGKLGIGKNLGD